MSLPPISEKTRVHIQLSLLLLIVGGVWASAFHAAQFSHRMESIEKKLDNQWTYQMEVSAWELFSYEFPDVRGKTPDIPKIRDRYSN